MKCPSCGVPFSTPPAACPKCKLTLAQLDQKFGLVPYCSRYLSDRAERLTGQEIEDLRAVLRLFERKFPQIVFAVLVINLGEQISMSEYAFWLGNRARFSSVGAVGPKNFDLLLIVDPQGRAAAMVAGYGLEKYLGEQDLQDTLDAASGFPAGELARGIRESIEFLTTRLRDIALRIEEAAFAAKTATAVAAKASAS